MSETRRFDRLAVLAILHDLNQGRTIADMAARSRVSEEWMQRHVDELLAQYPDIPRDFRFERPPKDVASDGARE